MEKELYIMQMEMYIRDNGSMIKRTEKVHIVTPMELNTKVNGKMINSTAKDAKDG
jgi:hypothetical protein